MARPPVLPTIAAVAAAAGVSTATVSRVLNRPGAVSEASRRRVEAAVAKLGYVPNAGARSMMLGRSGTIGAIFPTIDNAIFAVAIDALQRRFAEADQQLLLATCDYDADAEMRQAANLVARGADGLVLCGTGQRPELLAFLRQRGLPCVHVMSLSSDPAITSVGFDNAAAMARVVRFLLDLGHRRIAMLAGIGHDNDRAAARIAGVRQGLHAAALALPPHRLVQRKYALAAARDGFRALMATTPAPTAIVCGNDVLAFGALLEAQRLGIEVPEKLSIIGFDDLELANQLQPALTTVRVPAHEMWRTAADRLLATLRGEAFARRTEIEVSLVVRGTTAPPPRTAPSPGRRQSASESTGSSV